ncbi:hypothetical protein D3C86_1255300 [compost metagenome]
MPFVDENFEEFAQNWPRFRDRIVLFLGAGASVGAVNAGNVPIPNAYDLRNALWREFKVPRGQPFNPEDLRLMSLEHAAAIIEAGAGRDEINRFLMRQFSCEKPMWQHLVLPHLKPLSIFTTNYDELVELGYKHHGPVPDVICDGREAGEGRHAIFKPHGSLGHSTRTIGQGGLVITQFDYFSMISDYRKMLKRSLAALGQACVVIAGYSFGDMDIGAELYALRKDHPGTPWYAVFPRTDAQVRTMYSQRFDIRQIGMTLEAFLAELDRRVDFIPAQHKHTRRKALTARGVIQ